MTRALFALLLLLLGAWKPSTGTRIKGVVTHVPQVFYETDKVPLSYLAKFGVAAGHEFFVFGTVQVDYTKLIGIRSQMMLALVPQNISDNLVAKYNSFSCNVIFTLNSTLGQSIFVDDNDKCSSGTKDYVRKFPCSNEPSTSCNQPMSIPIIHGNNFTFHVENAPKTEFYYLYMLACSRNSSATCDWSETGNSTLQYDISLVNSNPQDSTYLDPFKYQFSLEQDGLLILHLFFSISYFILLTVHLLMHCGACKKLCYTSGCQMHRLPALFTASLMLEFVHVLFELIHYGVFASDGFGAVWCRYLGEVANQFSDWLLILVLLLIGKGWKVTDSALRWKKLTFGIWSAYVLFFSLYFVWTVIQDQVFPLSIWTTHTFQSVVGGFYLAYRLFLLGYILYEMRQIYLLENRPEKLKLYFCLSFLYIVWFCYLPFIVFVVAFIDPLFKVRVMSVFVLCFDFLANLGVVILFVPRWAKFIFQFSDSHLKSVLMNRSSYKGLKNFYGSSESTSNAI